MTRTNKELTTYRFINLSIKQHELSVGKKLRGVGKSLLRLGIRNLIVFTLFGIKETNEVEKQTSTKTKQKQKIK